MKDSSSKVYISCDVLILQKVILLVHECCLVNNGTDTIAVTAKHILLIARNKKTNSVSINNDLLLWSMKPKGNVTDSAVVNKLINDDTSEIIEGTQSSIFERDMLVLSISKASKNIYPLKPRYSTPRNG